MKNFEDLLNLTEKAEVEEDQRVSSNYQGVTLLSLLGKNSTAERRLRFRKTDRDSVLILNQWIIK